MMGGRGWVCSIVDLHGRPKLRAKFEDVIEIRGGSRRFSN
jgi:hypothetical protein